MWRRRKRDRPLGPKGRYAASYEPPPPEQLAAEDHKRLRRAALAVVREFEDSPDQLAALVAYNADLHPSVRAEIVQEVLDWARGYAPVQRQRMSAAQKRRYEDPAERAKSSSARQRYLATQRPPTDS